MTFAEVVKYPEAAAYIAIVLSVLGVPQMLSGYFDTRDRRGAREKAERARQAEREEAERLRQPERAEAERRHTEILRRLSVIESAPGIATEPDDDEGVA